MLRAGKHVPRPFPAALFPSNRRLTQAVISLLPSMATLVTVPRGSSRTGYSPRQI